MSRLTDMAVKVNDRNLSPFLIRRSQRRQRGGVVATQSQDARCLGHGSVRSTPAGYDLYHDLVSREPRCQESIRLWPNPMSLIQLPQRDIVVQPGQPDIPTVDDRRPRVEDAPAGVDARRLGEHALAAGPDAARSEPRAGAPGRGGVEGRPQDRNVVAAALGLVVREAVDVRQVRERPQSLELRAGYDVYVVVFVRR